MTDYSQNGCKRACIMTDEYCIEHPNTCEMEINYKRLVELETENILYKKTLKSIEYRCHSYGFKGILGIYKLVLNALSPKQEDVV